MAAAQRVASKKRPLRGFSYAFQSYQGACAFRCLALAPSFSCYNNLRFMNGYQGEE